MADFVCFGVKLIVELDGDRHDQPENVEADKLRTAFLEREGFRVLRYWNRELDESLDGVVHAILCAAREK